MLKPPRPVMKLNKHSTQHSAHFSQYWCQFSCEDFCERTDDHNQLIIMTLYYTDRDCRLLHLLGPGLGWLPLMGPASNQKFSFIMVEITMIIYTSSEIKDICRYVHLTFVVANYVNPFNWQQCVAEALCHILIVPELLTVPLSTLHFTEKKSKTWTEPYKTNNCIFCNFIYDYSLIKCNEVIYHHNSFFWWQSLCTSTQYDFSC